MCACTCSMMIIPVDMNVKCSPGASAKGHLSVLVMLWVSVLIFVIFSIVKVSRGRVSVMANIKIIKEEVSNLKENLEGMESDECMKVNEMTEAMVQMGEAMKSVKEDFDNFLIEVYEKIIKECDEGQH